MTRDLAVFLLTACLMLRHTTTSDSTPDGCDKEFGQGSDRSFNCTQQECNEDTWGTYLYTWDSSVCTAAWNDGRILPWSNNSEDRRVTWSKLIDNKQYFKTARYGAQTLWYSKKYFKGRTFTSPRKLETLFNISVVIPLTGGEIYVYGGTNVNIESDAVETGVHVNINTIPTKPPAGGTIAGNGSRRHKVFKATDTFGAYSFTVGGNKKNLYSRVVALVTGDCLDDDGVKGSTYRGRINVTQSNAACKPWSEYKSDYFSKNYPRQFTMNYCRNTVNDKDTKGPWCVPVTGGWEHCYIPVCKKAHKTVRVSVNDTNVSLQQQSISRLNARWTKDGGAFYGSGSIASWNGKFSNVIDKVHIGHGGVYVLHHYTGPASAPLSPRDMLRLIVRVCPQGKYGGSCEHNCPLCLNGGVCHDVVGECICAPGFKGPDCSTACGPNTFGFNCTSQCSDNVTVGCMGKSICYIDPYGCSCATGYTGQACDQECDTNYYGADCVERCGRCLTGACDKFTGHCNGGCESGFIAPYCKDCFAGKKGANCDQDCTDGHYGLKCAHPCGKCKAGKACNKVTGNCTACKPGFKLPTCHEEIAFFSMAPNVTRSSTEISVTWRPWSSLIDRGVGSVHKYIVMYRVSINDSWTQSRDVDKSVRTLTIPSTDLQNKYRVRIVIKIDSGEVGKNSPRAMACAVPAVPVLQTTPSVSSVLVSWNEPNWQCPSVGTFTLFHKNGSQSVWSRVADMSSKTLNRTLPSLACTTWSFKIQSQNKHLASNISREYNTTSLEKTANRVQELTNSSVTPTTIGISWRSPVPNGCCVKDYEIQCELKEVLACGSTLKKSDELLTLTTETLATSLDNLRPYARYEISVRARTATLDGDEEKITLRTIVSAPSKPPINLRSSENSSNSLKFTWQQPSCLSWNGPITRYDYQLHRQKSPCLSEEVSNGSINILSHKFDSLHSHTNYSFRVRASNNNLPGPWSEWSYSVTAESAPPAPRNLNVVDMNITFVTIGWKPPCPSKGVIREYRVRHRSLNDSEDFITTPRSECSSLTLFNLKFKHIYEFQIRAKTSEWGSWSNSVYETIEEGVPDRPNDVICKSREQTSISVGWVEPTRKNGYLTRYNISWTPKNGRQVSETVRSSTLTFDVHDLEPGTRYTFHVQASTSVGFGPPAARDCWTALSDIPKFQLPQTDREEVTSTTATLPVVPVKDYQNKEDIRFYLMVVEMRAPRKYAELIDVSTLKGFSEARAKGSYRYITANLTLDDVLAKESFIIGDGKVYGDYTNVALEEGKKYRFHLGVIVQNDVEMKTHFQVYPIKELTPGGYLEGRKCDLQFVMSRSAYTRNYKQEKLLMIGGAGGGVAAFLFVAVILVLVYLRRRRSIKKEMSPDVQLDRISTEEMPVDNSGNNAYANVAFANSSPQNSHPPPSEPVYEDFNKPIKIEDLVSYVGRVFGDDTVVREYESLPNDHVFPHDAGSKEQNKKKNRFKNILTYDKNRVVLETLPHDANSDYINASYIDAYNSPKAFIATIGPNKHTVDDFWRMIWQEGVRRIVMVTKCVEDGKRKCEQYWPVNTAITHGDIKVVPVDIEREDHYTIRKFEIVQLDTKAEPLKTTQYHFTSWPDHGVPSSSSALWKFHQIVKDHIREDNDGVPTVVHCSAGVGRTGTFIMMDILSDQAEAEGAIDVMGQLRQLRQQRVNMVQTLGQYKFIYTAMVEKLHSGDTFIPTAKFVSRLKELTVTDSILQKEFRTVNRLCHAGDDEEYAAGRLKENISKNRDQNILPLGRSRPYLVTAAEKGGNDYINAVFVDGYNQRDAFIVTQSPLPNTVGDFWRMVHDHECHVIVMLNDTNGKDDKSPQYWPDEGTMLFERYEIKFVGSRSHHCDVIKQRTLTLTDNMKKPNDRGRTIKHFEVKGWPNKLVAPPAGVQSALIELLEIVESSRHQTGEHAVVVHCWDGCARSGYLCALANLFGKIKVEKGVDVFQTVKKIRSSRWQFIVNLAQYTSLYHMAERFIQAFDTYANFS